MKVKGNIAFLVVMLVTALLVALSTAAGLAAAGGKDPNKEKYIDKYKDLAIKEMHSSGIPASITLAQGILESRSGLSPLAVKGKNHFGIKCHQGWKGKTMRLDDDEKNECFRVYDKVEDSYRDHSNFLRGRDRYSSLFLLQTTDYKGWAHGLKKCGYATSATYAGDLIKIIEDYSLYTYDTADDIPVAPSVIEEPVPYATQGRENFTISLERQLYSKNGVPFVYAQEGETYSSIAHEYDLFKREILKYNDLKTEETLLPGSIVYLQAKKKDAAKGLDSYVIEKDGEDLWEISQRFGIKLSALKKKNKLKDDYIPKEGDMLLLRGKLK